MMLPMLRVIHLLGMVNPVLMLFFFADTWREKPVLVTLRKLILLFGWDTKMSLLMKKLLSGLKIVLDWLKRSVKSWIGKHIINDFILKFQRGEGGTPIKPYLPVISMKTAPEQPRFDPDLYKKPDQSRNPVYIIVYQKYYGIRKP